MATVGFGGSLNHVNGWTKHGRGPAERCWVVSTTCCGLARDSRWMSWPVGAWPPLALAGFGRLALVWQSLRDCGARVQETDRARVLGGGPVGGHGRVASHPLAGCGLQPTRLVGILLAQASRVPASGGGSGGGPIPGGLWRCWCVWLGPRRVSTLVLRAAIWGWAEVWFIAQPCSGSAWEPPRRRMGLGRPGAPWGAGGCGQFLNRLLPGGPLQARLRREWRQRWWATAKRFSIGAGGLVCHPDAWLHSAGWKFACRAAKPSGASSRVLVLQPGVPTGRSSNAAATTLLEAAGCCRQAGLPRRSGALCCLLGRVGWSARYLASQEPVRCSAGFSQEGENCAVTARFGPDNWWPSWIDSIDWFRCGEW